MCTDLGKRFVLTVVAISFAFTGNDASTPLSSKTEILANAQDVIKENDLEYLGSTRTKQLYVTKSRKATFHFALGFGCNFVYDATYNLSLASIETLDEVALLDTYFARTQSANDSIESLWTSGFDRLGKIKGQWASTGKEIHYPTMFVGDWSPGQGSSPVVANYNCVAIWRYCNKHGHGPAVPSCTSSPRGTWFTPRPCDEEKRYICERDV